MAEATCEREPAPVVPVSVVIPAYNAIATLGATLDSVRRQTCRPAEILVVDDGSSDGTAALAQSLGARVLRQPNAGVCRARNAAIAAASNRWIAFLDADDLWEPAKLEAQWNLLRAHPEAVFSFTNYAFFGGAELRVPGGDAFSLEPAFRSLRRTALAAGAVRVERGAMAQALVHKNFVSPSTVMVDREFLRAHDCYFNESLPVADDFAIGEEWEWYLRLLRHADAFVVEAPLVRYRLTEKSTGLAAARIRYGDVKLGEIIVADPPRYGAEIALGFERMRHRKLLEAGWRYLANGRPRPARTMFALSLATRPTLANLLLALGSAALDNAPGRRLLGFVGSLWSARPSFKSLRARPPGTSRG